uniref:Putative secreted protein n=1 Tax=Anopheles marajoara TaxID=58244 RepID=A0A2M4C6L3_9DIPT
MGFTFQLHIFGRLLVRPLAAVQVGLVGAGNIEHGRSGPRQPHYPDRVEIVIVGVQAQPRTQHGTPGDTILNGTPKGHFPQFLCGSGADWISKLSLQLVCWSRTPNTQNPCTVPSLSCSILDASLHGSGTPHTRLGVVRASHARESE